MYSGLQGQKAVVLMLSWQTQLSFKPNSDVKIRACLSVQDSMLPKWLRKIDFTSLLSLRACQRKKGEIKATPYVGTLTEKFSSEFVLTKHHSEEVKRESGHRGGGHNYGKAT